MNGIFILLSNESGNLLGGAGDERVDFNQKMFLSAASSTKSMLSDVTEGGSAKVHDIMKGHKNDFEKMFGGSIEKSIIRIIDVDGNNIIVTCGSLDFHNSEIDLTRTFNQFQKEVEKNKELKKAILTNNEKMFITKKDEEKVQKLINKAMGWN